MDHDVVRCIRPDEADSLRNVRLAALADSPSAFGSTYAGESSLTAKDWADRARAGSAGSERAPFFAVADDDIVGLIGGHRPEPTSSRVELVSMWTHPIVRRTGVGRLLVKAVLDGRCAGCAGISPPERAIIGRLPWGSWGALG
jgi:hypothetical protein